MQIKKIIKISSKSLLEFYDKLPEIDFGTSEISILNKSNCKLAFSTEPNNFISQTEPLSIPRFGFNYGGKIFIKSKLFLGRYWNKIKDFGRQTEFSRRKKIKSFL